MTDELTEAIEYLTAGQGSANLAMAGIAKPDWDALAALLNAARAYAEGRQILACENPNHADGTCTTNPGQCDYARWKGYDLQDEANACSIVTKRLCDERRNRKEVSYANTYERNPR